MVQVLAHRGIWRKVAEQNTEKSLVGALRAGYGLETDIRDNNGQIVISHDMPVGSIQTFADFLVGARDIGTGTLALNVKADGMAKIMALRVSDIRNRCFFFDMSVPDMCPYFTENLPVFTRHSDAETAPAFYEQAAGVWLDELNKEWISAEVIQSHLSNGKKVAVVSGELHSRDHRRTWKAVRPFSGNNSVMICTDFPERFETEAL